MSTFIYEIPNRRRNMPYVEFMMGGQHHVLTYEGFAQAMGLDTTTKTMTERQCTRFFHYQEAHSAICRSEHREQQIRASNTNVVKFRRPWRILHTLLTRSVIPSL
ncbi:unnamed protein product [Linum trigynum]|uniref:Uncharacterized protein n=1 Tax=Linum trigynum TaxID=586398 RepID=A0AAV2E7L5_9ROSI